MAVSKQDYIPTTYLEAPPPYEEIPRNVAESSNLVNTSIPIPQARQQSVQTSFKPIVIPRKSQSDQTALPIRTITHSFFHPSRNIQIPPRRLLLPFQPRLQPRPSNPPHQRPRIPLLPRRPQRSLPRRARLPSHVPARRRPDRGPAAPSAVRGSGAAGRVGRCVGGDELGAGEGVCEDGE